MSEELPEDFADLLDMEGSDAVRAPAIPGGTYLALLKSNEAVRSNPPKLTPGLLLTYANLEPQEDVDHSKWKEYTESPVIDDNNISMQERCWLTPKSMFRLKDICIAAGADENQKVGKMVADSMNCQILIVVKQSVGSDGASVFSEIVGHAVAPE